MPRDFLRLGDLQLSNAEAGASGVLGAAFHFVRGFHGGHHSDDFRPKALKNV